MGLRQKLCSHRDANGDPCPLWVLGDYTFVCAKCGYTKAVTQIPLARPPQLPGGLIPPPRPRSSMTLVDENNQLKAEIDRLKERIRYLESDEVPM